MKMPEPVGFASELGLRLFSGSASDHTITLRHQCADGHQPLYDKQALIDLLEEAAKKCDERANGENDAQHCADSIRSMKETI